MISDTLRWPEWQWFDALESLLKACLSEPVTKDWSKAGVVFPLLDSVADSLGSFRLLVNQHKLRDSYVIARVLYETSVNICFLLTDIQALSDRANIHANQKTLRGLIRAIEIAGDEIFSYEMQGARALMEHPEHKKSLQEFTSKSGREITAWTPENVQQRLEAVYSVYGKDDTRGLAFGILLYRHASEIAHGTLYGTLFSWGATEVGRRLNTPEDIGEFRRKELRHLMNMVSYSLESLICIIGAALKIADIAATAKVARADYYKNRGEGIL